MVMDTVAVGLVCQVRSGDYEQVLTSDAAKRQIQQFVDALHGGERPAGSEGSRNLDSEETKLAVTNAAFNAFLQTNVTGPVLNGLDRVEAIFSGAAATHGGGTLTALRRLCFTSLDVDGVSVYPYIPNIELFCLSRYIVTSFRGVSRPGWISKLGLRGLELRINVWHFKLLAQPNLGNGSVFNKTSQWSDVPSLEELIEKDLAAMEELLFREIRENRVAEARVLFLIEKANVCIMLGQDAKAKASLKQAAEMHKFSYALSGALGKRTRFQQKSTSQLVVLAKSRASQGHPTEDEGTKPPQIVPEAVSLNDDTLLEQLEFSKETPEKEAALDAIPPELADLSPDAQPQLSPLDQIILLTEATLKDAFSPADTLTSEEILPFAVRVISDKSTNWQIYTQALLVRSRIEIHRSRTVERGVLQMQAVVDQVIVDTTAPPPPAPTESSTSVGGEATDVPAIHISGPGEEPNSHQVPPREKPTSFFPVARQEDTAPAPVRLKYVHALSSPPRWHLESELAYSWIGVGSFVSALEIFKRLRLWAEVALCLASSAAAGDADGRGSGGDEKARAVLRWRLFHRTGTPATSSDPPEEDIDISDLRVADYSGPERTPPPPNAPRLFCILGDIENETSHYERAWELSKHRYAQAQRSLGECYLQKQEWVRARDAYQKAVAVNRLSPELWNRLGDITLRLGEFSDAAAAFGRAIATATDSVGGEDARTWSNLGSSLYSMYVERMKEIKKEQEEKGEAKDEAAPQPASDEEEVDEAPREQGSPAKQEPSTLLSQSLAAYKRGASIANDNWRIWDNVLTIASRVRPPSVPDMLLALRHIVQIRGTEDALDSEVLRLLLNSSVLSLTKPDADTTTTTPYEPPRGSPERAVCDFLETAVAPLITSRAELWEIVARARVWRRDYAGAVDASERAWRAAVGGVAGGVSLGGPAAADSGRNWLEDKEAWGEVVERTDDLVSMLENYGPEVPAVGTRWKSKAKSAVRSVMGKAKGVWEGSEEWEKLQGLLDGLK